MLDITQYFGKQIKASYVKYTGHSIINVIGFDKDNDILMETVLQVAPRELPKKGVENPFTVDKLWFNQELTGRIIEILT
jgi:hypothetical protein